MILQLLIGVILMDTQGSSFRAGQHYSSKMGPGANLPPEPPVLSREYREMLRQRYYGPKPGAPHFAGGPFRGGRGTPFRTVGPPGPPRSPIFIRTARGWPGAMGVPGRPGRPKRAKKLLDPPDVSPRYPLSYFTRTYMQTTNWPGLLENPFNIWQYVTDPEGRVIGWIPPGGSIHVERVELGTTVHFSSEPPRFIHQGPQ